MYNLNLTENDLDAIYFAGYRYGWSNTLISLGIEVGNNKFLASQMWEWRDAIIEDTEGNHGIFPLLDSRSELFQKLLKLWESIV